MLHKEREGRNERLQEEQGHQGLRARKRLRCQGWQCKGSGLKYGFGHKFEGHMADLESGEMLPAWQRVFRRLEGEKKKSEKI